jgi:Rho-binding antiterminator
MQAYIPIPCVEHERLEFAVLRRQKLVLQTINSAGQVQQQMVLPIDVATRDQAEWLTYRDDAGQVCVIRLDQIQSAKPVSELHRNSGLGSGSGSGS